MNRFDSAAKALGMTSWFVKASWSYITTKHFNSKVEFFVGVVPAWYRFTIETYADYRKHVTPKG